MTHEEAVNMANRYRETFPYRIVGIWEDKGEWDVFVSKTKQKQNDLLRKGFDVYLI
jgi:hypothetical protein